MFPEDKKDFEINGTPYLFRQGLIVIKKLMIYLILVLENLKIYLNLKTKGEFTFKMNICEEKIKENSESIKKKLKETKRDKTIFYFIDKSLLKMSMRELMSKIDIRDIVLYLRLSQLNFIVKDKNIKCANGRREKTIMLKKRKIEKKNPPVPNGVNLIQQDNIIQSFDNSFGNQSNPRVRVSYGSNSSKKKNEESSDWIEINVKEFEIDEILLAKRKRPDEELKHCFKALRKRVEKDINKELEEEERQLEEKNSKNKKEIVAKESKGKLKIKKEKIMEKFNFETSEFELYESKNITKSAISILKENKKFITVVRKYINEDFLIDEIKNNVLKKTEEIMNKQLRLEQFLKTMMTKQKKNGWILQNILNSLDAFETCSRLTILKRKSKSTSNNETIISSFQNMNDRQKKKKSEKKGKPIKKIGKKRDDKRVRPSSKRIKALKKKGLKKIKSK